MSSADSLIIRAKVRQLLPQLDLETATQRTIQQHLEAELGISLDDYKAVLKAEVDAFLSAPEHVAAPSEELEEPSAKKPRVQQHPAPAAAGGDGGGRSQPGPPGYLFSVPISAKRYAGVRQYNKRAMVDVREFYEKDSALAPGAKGLSMVPEQWAALTAALQPLTEALDCGDEAFYVDLGSNKRAGVSSFSGKTMLSLREFYEKGGQMLPGKKGITLPADQWTKLCAAHEELTARLEAVAGPLPAFKPSPGNGGGSGEEGPAAAAATAAPAAVPPGSVSLAPVPPGSVPLAPMRRAEVTEWKGKRMVSIREIYAAPDGELKPGKKGLTLTPEQFAALRLRASDVTAALLARDTAFEAELSPKRKVTISVYKGACLVDIREYYEAKGGQLAPGQKGIALPAEQWERLRGGLDGLAAGLEGA